MELDWFGIGPEVADAFCGASEFFAGNGVWGTKTFGLICVES